MTRPLHSLYALSRTLLAAAFVLAAMPASAAEIEVGDVQIRIDNLFTVGGLWRTSERDPSLIGKSTLYKMQHPDDPQGLCVWRTSPDPLDLNPNERASRNRFAGDTCTTSNLEANERFVNAPGAFSPNADDGNLNFDKGDLVHAAAKLTTDFSWSIADYHFFTRTLWLFDDQYIDLENTHYDETVQPPSSPNYAARETFGTSFDFLDYYVSKIYTVGDRDISVKLGNQVLNWGESAFLIINSLNSISPPDTARLRIPGFDVKELFQPVGMLLAGTQLFENVNLDVFYQYEWKPVSIDPPGTYFSPSDTLGPGGQYAMLSFGKIPDDPGVPTDQPDYYLSGMEGLYGAYNNPDDGLQTLGSTASRTVYRDHAEERRRRPDDGGQYGAALKLFLEDFNNGTEVGFYYANLHSRFPLVSAMSAYATCIPNDTGSPATNLAALAAPAPAGCGLTPRPDSPGDFNAAAEPLPADTMRLMVEYPEDRKMYGVSFNTTVGDWALSGEYVYRPNHPIQIHSTDLALAALGPILPEEDFNIGASVIPNHRAALPSFIPVYRNIKRRADGTQYGYGPNEYIQGWEDMKLGQLGGTLLKIIGGSNPINASQIIVLLETGLTHVMDFPELDELQFQGAGVDKHITDGADGTPGIMPADLRGTRYDVNDNGMQCPSARNPAVTAETVNPRCLRQNPQSQNPENFGDAVSYGYRLIFLPRWDNAFLGANIELLGGVFHDIEGVSPGVGTNFIEGRKTFLAGVRWDYQAQWVGEIRHTWITGGGDKVGDRDRDNLLLWLGYQF